MGFIAKWGPKAFVLSSSKVIPLLDLSTAVTLKNENNTDASGGVVSNSKNIDPQQIEFATTYLRAAGVDPRKEYEEWAALVGDTYTLYIGGKRFGPDGMTLGSISLSDVLLSATGEFLKATVAVVLTQAETTTKSSSSQTTSQTSSGNSAGSSSSTGSYYNASSQISDEEKEAAMETEDINLLVDDDLLWKMRNDQYNSPTPGGVTPWVEELK